jgi:hypothetical protein
MEKRIIYRTEEGGVAVVVPALDCGMSIEDIAKKDVPQGLSYAIVDADAIPSDRTFRAAWEVDSSELNDGVGLGPDAWFAQKFGRGNAR